MRKILTLLFVYLSSFTVSAQDKISEAIKNAESRLYAAVENNDLAVMDKFLHSRFMVQSNSGFFQDKNTLLDKFGKGNNPYQSFRPVDDSLIIVNKHIAIASGKETYIHKTGEEKGKEKSRHFMHVWIKHKGVWRLASRYISN